MSDFTNTVDVVGDEALTNSIIARSITEITDDYVAEIGNSAFFYCKNLTKANFLSATNIKDNAFGYCSALTEVNFPMATNIGGRSLKDCPVLTEVNFPMATFIGERAFQGCKKLTKANFLSAINIRNYAFISCAALTALILRSETVCTLSSTGDLSGTPIASGTGYIYVPRALVDTYKAATNWSTYANQFRALEDYTVDGTITGELDSTKI